MTLKQLLSAALTYLDLSDAVLDEQDALEVGQVKLLAKCAEFALDETAAEYLPIVRSEKLSASGKKIDNSLFSLQPLRVKKVGREGKTRKFRQRADCVEVEEDGEYEVEYTALPSRAQTLGSEVMTALPVPEKSLALGVCAHYAAVTGRYEQSRVFRQMFSEDMRALMRKSGVMWQ